jgi:hypothetical protein
VKTSLAGTEPFTLHKVAAVPTPLLCLSVRHFEGVLVPTVICTGRPSPPHLSKQVPLPIAPASGSGLPHGRNYRIKESYNRERQIRREGRWLGVWPSVEAEDLRLFPAETVPTEVTVRAGLLVDGLTKIQLLNDLSWSQVKVRLDNGEEFFLRQFRCTVIEYGDRQGFGDADRVRHLDQAPPAKTSFDQGLGDPASRVCRRPVHFGEVFSGECAAPVGAPPAVRVHDDLATGQTGIALQQTKRRSVRHVEEIR